MADEDDSGPPPPRPSAPPTVAATVPAPVVVAAAKEPPQQPPQQPQQQEPPPPQEPAQQDAEMPAQAQTQAQEQSKPKGAGVLASFLASAKSAFGVGGDKQKQAKEDAPPVVAVVAEEPAPVPLEVPVEVPVKQTSDAATRPLQITCEDLLSRSRSEQIELVRDFLEHGGSPDYEIAVTRNLLDQRTTFLYLITVVPAIYQTLTTDSLDVYYNVPAKEESMPLLHWAAFLINLGLAKLLVQHGASRSKRTAGEGHTAFQVFQKRWEQLGTRRKLKMIFIVDEVKEVLTPGARVGGGGEEEETHPRPFVSALATMSVADVSRTLRQLGLDAHVDEFAKQGIDGALLAVMDDDALKELKVDKALERKKILAHVWKLKNGANAGDLNTTSIAVQ